MKKLFSCLTLVSCLFLTICLSSCVNDNNHEHIFVENVSPNYLKSEATCTEKAIYFKSCECGVTSEETFEYENPLGHDYGNWVSNSNGTHMKICSHDSNHTLIENCSDSNKDHICDVCNTTINSCNDNDSDHYCDICGTKLSEHTGGEANCAHKAICDICGKEYGEFGEHSYIGWISNGDGTHSNECRTDEAHKVTENCYDKDNDHICDVCGVHITNCINENGDHNCDICGKLLESCLDEDNDHYCDVCGKQLSEHTGGEANCEHKAICSICDKEYGELGNHNYGEWTSKGNGKHVKVCSHNSEHTIEEECIDNNNDHMCDVCGDKITVCLDEDKNHNCDICGNKISECLDENNDHNCDICSNKLSDCLDEDNDHYCDYCNILLSECLDENNDHNCDICGKVLSYHQGGKANCQQKAICEICGEEYGSLGEHDFIDNTCTVCGKKNASEGLTFTFVDSRNNTYSVSGIGTCTDTDVVIPSSYKGKSVVSIATSAFSHTNITSVVIPDTIHTIGNSAFSSCTSLVSVTIPESIKSCLTNAFYCCENLENVYISNITSWCDIIFSNDSSNPLYNGTNLYINEELVTDLVLDEEITRLESYSFLGCKSITNLSTYADIYNKAFAYCENLTSITLNGESISYMSFYECINLKEIIFSENLKSIGQYAFYNCTGLTNIIIPENVTNIEFGAFYNCNNLEVMSITCYDWRIEKIFAYGSSSVLNGKRFPESLKKIILTSGTTIPDYDFYNCEYITTIEIPASLTNIGYSCFYNCKNLKNIYISDIESYMNIEGLDNLIKYISNYNIYLNNELLTNLVVPQTCKTVCGFSNCLSLISVVIPDDVEEISESAFYYCRNLVSIALGKNVKIIRDYAFDGCYKLLEIINYSNLSIEIGSTENGNIGYYAKIIHEGQSFIVNYNDYIFITIDEENYLMAYLGNEINLTLPESYNGEYYNIYEDAFYNCSKIHSITISSKVTSIGSSVFSKCTNLEVVYYNGTIDDWSKIEFDYFSAHPLYYIEQLYILDSNNDYCDVKMINEIKLNEGITSIGECVFYGFESLESVIIPDSVLSIGYRSFNNCNNLKYLTIPFVGESKEGDNNTHFGYIFGARDYEENVDYIPSSLKEVIVTSAVSIDEYSFYKCNSLKKIILPLSVLTIEKYAFIDCDNLESMTIPFIGKTQNDTENTYFNYLFGGRYNSTPSNLKEIVILGGINLMFNYTYSLESITIPSSINNIGDYAFKDCSNLKNVYYNGTIEDWCNISFSNYTSNPMYYAEHFYILDENNNYYEITEIEIPDSITKINNYQFYGFNNLTNILIPNNVTSINNYAFYNCSNLINVTIGNVVTSIGSCAFEKCLILENVYYNGTLEDWCNISFYSSTSNPMYYADHFYILDENNNYYEITEIKIPDSITKINNYQFYGFKQLNSISLSNNISSIGNSSFYNCNNIRSITLPSSLSIIDYYAFYGCYKLIEVVNNSSLEIEMGSSNYGYVAYYAKSIASEKSQIENIDGFNFITIDSVNYLISYNDNNSIIVLPEKYHEEEYSIYDSAFKSNQNITSVIISDGVVSIGASAFKECSNLLNITMGNNVTTIGEYAFYNCVKLKEVNLPENLISIDGNAFGCCYSLTSITLPENLISIGTWAFSRCIKLVEVINKSELLIEIGSYGNGRIGEYAKIVHNGESIIVNVDDFRFITVENVNYLIDYIGNETNIKLPENYNGESYEILNYTFFDCENLVEVEIPFGITSIGGRVFYGCTNLINIIIPNSIKSIGSYSFYGCTSLISVIIPESVETLEEGAFYNCINLSNIIILNNVITIEESVFKNCNNLTIVYYFGTQDDWKNILIDSYNSTLENAKIYYYSELEPNESGNYWHYNDNGEVLIW